MMQMDLTTGGILAAGVGFRIARNGKGQVQCHS